MKSSGSVAAWVARLLAVSVRFAIVLPIVLFLNEYLMAMLLCIGISDGYLLIECPLASLYLSGMSLVNLFGSEEFWSHVVPLALIALATAAVWAERDRRRYGEGWT